ncbi:10749_t:CDS:2 [Rhizophagus irregularis]|nr:10749_t:CDS:2 [Rhizophagus irregularis]
MTDSTKSRKKLVYAEELNHIADLLETLPHSETTIAVLDDVHQKINHIRENDAIATQVRGIALKIPIGKVASMIVAMIPTRGDEGADQIAHLICYDQLFELAHQSQHFLLERDVLNVYKQDDRAALRTFHSNTLIQISVSGTLTDDLFLLRELCDAYLNRTIDHKTRIEMIQQRVSYRDKISRAGIIDTNRDRNSAAGYIFDIDGTSLPHKIIERLRIWPATDDIQESSLNRSSIVGNAALEISRILSDSQNENDQLYEENSDDDENEEIIQQLPSFGEFPDIQYIIQHSRPIPITFTHFNNFFTDDILNIITLLQIHQCHDAFSPNNIDKIKEEDDGKEGKD